MNQRESAFRFHQPEGGPPLDIINQKGGPPLGTNSIIAVYRHIQPKPTTPRNLTGLALGLFPNYSRIYEELANMAGSASQFSHPSGKGGYQNYLG
jgi:hypothetical protein